MQPREAFFNIVNFFNNFFGVPQNLPPVPHLACKLLGQKRSPRDEVPSLLNLSLINQSTPTTPPCRRTGQSLDATDIARAAETATAPVVQAPSACHTSEAPCIIIERGMQITFDPEYRGTSFIRNCPPLGPYSRTIPTDLWWHARCTLPFLRRKPREPPMSVG